MGSRMDSVIKNKIKTISQNETWLFVPATRIDRVAKAFASGADAKHYSNITTVQVISRFGCVLIRQVAKSFSKT